MWLKSKFSYLNHFAYPKQNKYNLWLDSGSITDLWHPFLLQKNLTKRGLRLSLLLVVTHLCIFICNNCIRNCAGSSPQNVKMGHHKEMIVFLHLRAIYLVFHSFLFWFTTGPLDLLRPHVTHSSIIVMWVSQGCLLLFPPSIHVCATGLNLVSLLCRLEHPNIHTRSYLYATAFAEMVSGVKILLYLELINRGNKYIL